MKLLRINSEISVAPDLIAMVQTDSFSDGVHIHLRDGTSLWVDRDYNSTQFKTKDRLEREINEAMG